MPSFMMKFNKTKESKVIEIPRSTVNTDEVTKIPFGAVGNLSFMLPGERVKVIFEPSKPEEEKEEG